MFSDSGGRRMLETDKTKLADYLREPEHAEQFIRERTIANIREARPY